MKTSKINYFDLKDENLSFEKMSEIAIDAVTNVGYIIFQNFPIDSNGLKQTKENFLKLSELIGKPISHDENNSIIWDIKSNDASESFVKTYSEHSHEAELHTDSQYSFYPEDYFGLLSLVKADCGGGLSYLLSLDKILIELAKLTNGEEIITILTETDFPFIVPNVFKKDKSKKYEFNFGPILRQNEIRFRIDTFEKALKVDASLCSSEQLMAYKALKKIIEDKEIISSLQLNPRDLLVINNKTMLHGRSEFTDKKRHLLRIRMNKN
jgi:alpha-ketoglutarate-dependent taurine dioxygenase